MQRFSYAELCLLGFGVMCLGALLLLGIYMIKEVRLTKKKISETPVRPKIKKDDVFGGLKDRKE